MKILLCHNYYQHPGGEDGCFHDEGRLLEEHGHEVLRYTMHNEEIRALGELLTARLAIWNHACYDQLRTLLKREQPDVMHCTNTFPLISPAAYQAARDEGVAVVQALHNYRLLCPNALFLRDGKVCEDCLGKTFAWPGILHACYRESYTASAAVAAMVAWHKLRGTWKQSVNRFYALTEFSRSKFIAGGLPAEKVLVKPNFVFDRDPPGRGEGGYFVYAGRLSEEKGLSTLLAAWSRLPSECRLKIVGQGPLEESVRRAVATHPNIEWLGQQSQVQVIALLGSAVALVFPSVCYENFPRTIVEAFSQGTPVVASRLGVMAELIAHHRTGLLFAPGNAQELSACIRELLANSSVAASMRSQARDEFTEKYTADRNHQLLIDIYRRACDDLAASINPEAAAESLIGRESMAGPTEESQLAPLGLSAGEFPTEQRS